VDDSRNASVSLSYRWSSAAAGRLAARRRLNSEMVYLHEGLKELFISHLVPQHAFQLYTFTVS
jgi:hypothetical protein